jgi:Ner family transcriptional regulator
MMPGRVVIVEDDTGLAYAFGRIVERLGHEVTVFTNAVEAWDDLKAERRPSLLITDIVFPGNQPDGVALAAHAGTLHPHLPVIYVTGYPKAAATLRTAPDEEWLLKPVAEDTLTRCVQRLARPETRTDWHPADIAAALKKRGLSLANLSLSYGYHHTAVGKALKQPWPAVERIIAAALDCTPQDLWPSRYADDGLPLHRTRAARVRRP